VSVSIIKIWMDRDRKVESLESRTGRRRKTVLTRVAKIVLATAVQKKTPVNEEFVQKTDSEGSTGVLDDYPQPPDQVLALQAA